MRRHNARPIDGTRLPAASERLEELSHEVQLDALSVVVDPEDGAASAQGGTDPNRCPTVAIRVHKEVADHLLEPGWVGTESEVIRHCYLDRLAGMWSCHLQHTTHQ
jgi:hypothetical protein